MKKTNFFVVLLSVLIMNGCVFNSSNVAENDHNIESGGEEKSIYSTNITTFGKSIEGFLIDFNSIASKSYPTLTISKDKLIKQSIQDYISSLSTQEAMAAQRGLNKALESDSHESWVISAMDVADITDLSYLYDDLDIKLDIYSYKYPDASSLIQIMTINDDGVDSEIYMVIVASKITKDVQKYATDLTYLYVLLSLSLAENPDFKQSTDLVSNTFRQLRDSKVSEVAYDSVIVTTYVRSKSITEIIIKPL